MRQLFSTGANPFRMKVRCCSRAGIALLLWAGVLLPGCLRAQSFPPDRDLQPMLRFIAEDGGAGALVLGLLEADGARRVVSHGVAGEADAPPLGPTSVFEIGSITKTFTATLLADMVLRGEVALEDPVAAHLPRHVRVPSRHGREITLLDLATHRSGLPAMPDNLGPRNPSGIYPGYTVDSLYAFLSGHELDSPPGSGYLYSNLNYGLLGHALARAAGTSYRELVRQRILVPLDMAMTDVATTVDAPAVVTGHRGGVAAPQWQGTEALQGAGGIRSTAEDMLKYIEAHVGVPRSGLEQAMRFALEVRVPDGAGGGRGLAWTIRATGPGEHVAMHGGVTAGFSARLAMMPEHGTGTILLANERSFTFRHRGGSSLLFPLPPDSGWLQVTVAPDVLARYEGTYARVEGRGAYDVSVADDGRLMLRPRGRPPVRLHATSDTMFHVLGTGLSLVFRDDGGGSVFLEARRRTGDREVVWTAVPHTAGVGWPLATAGVAVLALLAVAILVAGLRRLPGLRAGGKV